MKPNTSIQNALQEISQVFAAEPCIPYDEAAKQLCQSERVFVAGAGRSGLVSRMLAMRLMQMGLTCYVVGSATTPAIGKGDTLLVISGSGETATMCTLCQKAKAVGATILLLTHAPQSTLASTADTPLLLSVPNEPTRPGGIAGEQLLGTLFEQCALIACDVLVQTVADLLKQDGKDLALRHANLE